MTRKTTFVLEHVLDNTDQSKDCNTLWHTPRHCLETKRIICARSVYRQKNGKKQHCTKAMINDCDVGAHRLSQLRKSAKKQPVHSLTYTTSLPWDETHHLCQIRISTKKRQKAALHQSNDQWLRRWCTSFVPAPEIDKKTARSLHRPKAMIATLTYTRHVSALTWRPETHHLSQIRISTKKQQKAA